MDVKFTDGTHALAVLLWADPPRDVAIMALQTATKIKPAKLASVQTKAGDEVWSVGYPLDLPLSVAHGIVTHDGVFDAGMGGDDHYKATVMIDATVLEGDSGGPVFNAAGRNIPVI
jgi:putative serine protease PepD